MDSPTICGSCRTELEKGTQHFEHWEQGEHFCEVRDLKGRTLRRVEISAK